MAETVGRRRGRPPKKAPEPPVDRSKEMRVRAVFPDGNRCGFIDNIRVRDGDVFTLREKVVQKIKMDKRGRAHPLFDENHQPVMRTITVNEQFSPHWMEPVDDEEEESITGAQAALQRASDDIASSRRAG